MFKKILYITFFIISLSFPYISLRAAEEPDDAEEFDDAIVEKNLFSPERKKWIMERPKKEEKKKKSKKDKKKLRKIELFGTVITGKQRYAVLRVGKGKRKSKFYMVGDYISGYLLKEIDRKRVVLRDDSENEDYIIFINEGKKSRTAVKTEIKAEAPPGKKSKKAVRKKKKAPKPKKARTAKFLMKRLEKDVKVLRQKDSKLVERQAEKDYKRLEKLLPHMSDKEVRKAIELKKELDRLKE